MRPKIMGVVNVTPDSFSDGGRHDTTEAAIAHGLALLDDGAHVLDVGGESTRPGAQPVDEATEIARAIPVIAGLHAARPDAVLSIDTSKPAVADAAAAAGATILNDVTASLESVAARNGMGWIAMHASGPSATMQDDPHYDDVVGEVASYLADAAERGRAAGLDRLWVDPGFGFGKTIDHNLALVANLDRLTAIAPVVLAVSRKNTIGRLHTASDQDRPVDDVEPTPVDDRLEGSLAMATWGGILGVDMVRVHDVRATVHAVGVMEPWG
ncbi:MAG: dihydropteroate synthase [Actinomycetota bacterium]